MPSQFNRSSGVLLPVSCLPSPYGIGTFGKAAYDWVDFLHKAGQTYWQILPLGPTGYGDSPYQCFSAFSGNPYFIDLDKLSEEGLLKPEECTKIKWCRKNSQVDYEKIYNNRETVLRKAKARFTDKNALQEFINQNPWVEEYALFMSIKATQGGISWQEWHNSLRLRETDAINHAKTELAEDIEYHIFVQYKFFVQWNALRRYVNEKGMYIIGDIPIYTALDSVDVWTHPELFQLDENKHPLEVAGCPPDGFTEDGQLWGNPLYNWEKAQKNDYKWWIQRLKSGFSLYDVMRIDHFRGFESYFAIPYGDKTAKNGVWKKGPGIKLINAIKKAIPHARIIAEDLGYLTDEVRQLLSDSGYPGMKVIQFAFDTRESEVNDYLPYTYEKNTVVFPGTHDNETMRGWAESAPEDSVLMAMEYVNVSDKKEIAHAVIRLAMESNADLAVIPMQDWLNLGNEARMNTPSVVDGNNWRWRLISGDINDELAGYMSKLTKIYGRIRN